MLLAIITLGTAFIRNTLQRYSKEKMPRPRRTQRKAANSKPIEEPELSFSSDEEEASSENSEIEAMETEVSNLLKSFYYLKIFKHSAK